MSEKDRDHLPALLEQLGRSDPATARALLERAAREHPDDGRPLLLLAAQYMHAQEIDLAEATYMAALERAPDLAIARFQLGLLQFSSARPAVAQATWAPLDRLDPKEPLRLFKTGLELLGQDRFDEARRFIEAGLAENTTNPALNRDMQMVLDEMTRRNLGGETTSGANGDEAQPPLAEREHFLISSYRRTQ
jgi:Flp pilus assembly protein TadD